MAKAVALTTNIRAKTTSNCGEEERLKLVAEEFKAL
jgi:hypothetical protein